MFAIAPNPVLAGHSVAFDGAGSSDANGPIARYEWDLDGDGSFETDTGTTPQATKTYTQSGSVAVQLRVTDGVGNTSIATNTLVVTAAVIAGQLGVTINGGAQYTNSPNVTLGVLAPASITQLLVSNDGGFLSPTVFAPAKTLSWRLDSSGPERLPKTVYLRFISGAVTSPNYTDDIILDERPPVVQQASVTPAAGAASAAKLRKWTVTVKATDSNSGVAGIQVATNKRKPTKLAKYKKKLTVRLGSRPKFVRARDRAGNNSRWKKLR
jgi:PKD repeat protein